jgi:phosphatidyl-myo-inositol alpha-mannosyltransferase
MVCPYDLSVPGGVQSQVRGLAAAMTRTGAAVSLIAPVSRLGVSPGGVNESYDLVSVGRSVSIAVNGSRAPVAPGPIAMGRTVKALRRLRGDVVHVHEPLAPGAALAAFVAGPRPLLGTFHRAGTDPVYRAEALLLRPLARRLDAAVAVSEAARATALEALGSRLGDLEVIPNGVELSPSTPPPDASSDEDEPAPSRARQASTQGEALPLRIVFVGRHEERKGLTFLLEAAETLRRPGRGQALPPWRLVVIGEGPETNRLRCRFRDLEDVEWLGPADDATRSRVLASADAFVAPSLGGESFGVILLEAMAAGAPVIASDLPGYRLAAGAAARFVPAGNAEALAEDLAAVLSSADERRRLELLGRERVSAYSMEAVAGRYLDLYARLSHVLS